MSVGSEKVASLYSFLTIADKKTSLIAKSDEKYKNSKKGVWIENEDKRAGVTTQSYIDASLDYLRDKTAVNGDFQSIKIVLEGQSKETIICFDDHVDELNLALDKLDSPEEVIDGDLISNMMFPSIVMNIMNFLKRLENMFIELNVMFYSYDINESLSMRDSDKMKMHLQLKYSSCLYKTRFSCFFSKLHVWLQNQFIYRHFGKKERFRIDYERIFIEIYEIFLNQFCEGKREKYNDFVIGSESFDIIVKHLILKSERPCYANSQYLNKKVSKKKIKNCQNQYEMSMSMFIELLNYCNSIYEKRDSSYNLMNYNLGQSFDISRVDVEHDIIVDKSVIDLIDNENRMFLTQHDNFFRTWLKHNDIAELLKEAKYNEI